MRGRSAVCAGCATPLARDGRADAGCWVSTRRVDFKDYYATLGVTKTATEKEIKQAFRKLARKHHPDVNPGDKTAEAKFKEINEAHEVLGDPEKRKKYDELGANWRMYEQAGRWRAVSPARGTSTSAAASRAAARTMTEDEMREHVRRRPTRSRTSSRPSSAERWARSRRRGRSARRRARQAGSRRRARDRTGSRGRSHGTTRRLATNLSGQSRTVDVRIPAGVGDGSRVRIAGEGEHRDGGAPSGDLYLRIRLTPHPMFERRGKDSVRTRGGAVDDRRPRRREPTSQTLGGKTLRLKVPPATQNGQVFRFKGHGMPTAGKPDQTGDLYATVDVQLPRELTPEQRAHFEALRKLEESSRLQASGSGRQDTEIPKPEP